MKGHRARGSRWGRRRGRRNNNIRIVVPVKAVVVAAVAKFGPLVLLWFLGAWVRVECLEFGVFGAVSWV